MPLDIVVGICVGAAVLIISIIIAIVVIVMVKRHLATKSKLQNVDECRQMEFSNEAYAAEELSADRVDSSTKDNQNGRNGHYEHRNGQNGAHTSVGY